MPTIDRGLIIRPMLALALLATALVVSGTPAEAATFMVTANRITGTAATDDPVPVACAADDCSLREAVIAANAAAGPDLITFEVPGTIALELSNAGADMGDLINDLDVTDELEIVGHADGTTIDASGFTTSVYSRIFDVENTGLALRGVTLTGATTLADGGAIRVSDGELVLDATTLIDNAADYGGAIYLASSSLVASASTLSDNTSNFNGGAIGSDDYIEIAILDSTLSNNRTGVDQAGNPGIGGYGGAIDANGATDDASLVIHLSDLVDNVAIYPMSFATGGAINLANGTATITRSWFEGNGLDGGVTTTFNGGAIYAQGPVQIEDSAIVGNSAEFGGGLELLAGGRISRSYLADNTASDGVGGGLLASTGIVDIENTTVTGNGAHIGGGGVHVGRETEVSLTHVTLADNDGEAGLFVELSSIAEVSSSIIAQHDVNCDGDGTITSLGYNTEDADDCGLAGTDDEPNTDPRIAPAADNGGALQGVTPGQRGLTMALQADSPAIDTADPALCGTGPFTVDQRGEARPDGPNCDRGAYEGQEDTPPPGVPGCDASGPGASDPVIEPGINRVQGLNRIQTAIAASQAICGDGQAPAVVLTRADLFPDAQAGTPLAIELGAPLLLTQPQSLATDTEVEIQRVLPPGGTVYLLGGEVALNTAVADRLEDLGYDTIRYGGVDRFETAQIIARDGLDDPATILLTNGGDFADSVVAGAAATTLRDGDGHVAAAVLLTSGSDPSPFTEAYLQGRADDPDLIAVGAAAAAAHPDAEAVFGASRFETAIAVADRFFTDPVAVGFARNDDFADALTGGAIIGRSEIGPGPILLTGSDDLPAVVADWLADHAATIDTAIIFGGTAAVSADVEADIAAALGL